MPFGFIYSLSTFISGDRDFSLGYGEAESSSK